VTRRPAGLVVRAEAATDAPAIRAVHLAAFPTHAEADLVARVRAAGALLPELSLVAVLGDAIVGHILLSPVTLETGHGAEPVLELAPLAVLPDRQRQGIGSALVIAALDAAEVRDEPLVLVLGHPWFYPRFGFRPASAFGIRAPHDVPDPVFMVKPLTTYRRELSGQVVLPPAFAGV
jgi:putative acetyltransferase